MNLKSWPLAVLVLAFGCSASDGDTLTPWPIAEPEVAAEEPNQPVILRASEDDPFYGTSDDFFVGLPQEPQRTRCAGLVIDIPLRFERGTDPIVLVPRTMTHTEEVFGFETTQNQVATWVWESGVGLIWATNRLRRLDPFSDPSDRWLTISSYPYDSETPPPPVRDGNEGSRAEQLGAGPDCGFMPLEKAESMILPPQEFDLEILVNGTRKFFHLRAEVFETQNRRVYKYREIR